MTSSTLPTFGDLLRRHRQAAGLTQEELAARAGLSERGINDLERGARLTPRRDTVKLLADALGLADAERASLAAAARSPHPALQRAAPANSARSSEPSAREAGPSPPLDARPQTPALPGGTVTFLFTDVAGSTHLLQQLGPAAYMAALDQHSALVRDALAAHGGHEVNTQGDSFFVAFAAVGDALAAVAMIQRALATQAWPERAVVRVRMGLHAGASTLAGDQYVGLDVHRTARIAAAAHGGQVLLSAAVRELARDELPAGATVRDLGSFRLKDLLRPEHLYQLCLDGLPADFPPLRALDARPHNLPIQPTPLLGREREVAAVAALLRSDSARLVTITGPGGVGKTRLGLQAAAELSAGNVFADGVWFVRLSRLTDPALVLPTIAKAFNLRESGGESTGGELRTFLHEKVLLLLLDNFEQVAVAAPQVGELLGECPGIRALITSRSPLHLRGEQEYPLAPLPLPDPAHLPEPERLSQFAAVALFTERAHAALPDFATTTASAPAVAEICARLDGLPLAIELAAARVKLLSPPALLLRLGRTMPLLVGGAHDLEARQQTMRATLVWSEDLLGPQERRLFRRLSVFVGGCTLEAAEAVCAAPEGAEPLGIDLLEGLTSLVDQSLVQRRVEGGEDAETRFGMLQVIREYAQEQLEASGEAEALRRAHFYHFLALAEAGELELYRRDQLVWRARLDRELDNVRSALNWARDHAEVELGLRLAGALVLYWAIAGSFTEIRGRCEELLALAPVPGGLGAAISPMTRAKALFGAGGAAVMQGDTERGVPLLEESLALARELPGYVAGSALNVLGLAAMNQGDLERAMMYFEESLAQQRSAGEPTLATVPLVNLGEAAYRRGDLVRATAYLEECVELARRGGDRRVTASALLYLASVARLRSDLERAATLAREALTLMRDIGGPHYLAQCLQVLAEIAGAAGQGVRAARLLGAAETQREHSGGPLTPIERQEAEASVTKARAALGEAAWAAAFAAGRALSLEEAIAEALGKHGVEQVGGIRSFSSATSHR